MQQDETAATAMQNLIAKIFQEPTKFAALAGKSVKEFTTLLKTDANEALLQFFGAMKKHGGFDSLAPMFDKMGMDGSRCVSVFSVMADKLADIKTAQDIANDAYAKGTSWQRATTCGQVHYKWCESTDKNSLPIDCLHQGPYWHTCSICGFSRCSFYGICKKYYRG